jgi:hypothetical protein
MDSNDVLQELHRERIAVLHAVRPACTPAGRDLVVVFLEATYGQAEEARDCLRKLPGVIDVTFARHTKAIIYVFLDTPKTGCAPGLELKPGAERRPTSSAL